LYLGREKLHDGRAGGVSVAVLIGVDAGTFADVRAGVSRYLRETLSGMMVASPDDDFVLYSPVRIEVPLPRGRWRVRIPRMRRWSVPGHWLRDTIPRAIAEDGVDVFWGQNAMMPLRLRRPCRRVLTVHDVTGLIYPRTMRLSHRLSWDFNFRAAVRAADAVVAVSRATAQLVHRLVGTSAAKLVVIHEGCSSGLEPVARGDAQQRAAERFGLPEEFMLTVGTLEPRKDHATLLQVVRREANLPLLVIAGAIGWNSRGILRLVRRAESEGRARYVGRVSDPELAILYSAARLMLYPSLYEGFGLPVLEAMACGCPVLCSWSSSLPEVGGSAARYFRPRDTDDLSRQLRMMVGDQRLLSEMRVRGLERSARFSFSRAAEQVLDVLHRSAPVR
jgi:glycosyltransferase involved in cell wall biosynthesis